MSDHHHDHGPKGNDPGHSHDHSHSHGPTSFDRAFLIGITLNIGFVIVEAVYGFLANSLALLADAGHNLSDVLGLVLAWVAASLAKRRPSARFTYGMKRTPILASLANAMLLLVASGMIIYEAVQRFSTPAPVAETTVIWVALVGIVINGATALGFLSGRKTDVNIRGAFLHMVADAVVSLGVVLSGILVLFTGWLWVDPAVSIVVALVIVAGTWSLLSESVSLSLDAVPDSIDSGAIRSYLAGLPGVTEVHDLHIWPMSTTEVALTAHLVRPGATLDDRLLAQACRDLASRFGIHHATLQIEAGDPAHPCTLAPSEVV
ncbi:MAG TPA: cation diffusion facilitator family transporter [Reyranella sp.]|nr:cation diffusion facilitator family transporter [Reyranella sp.]